MDLFSLKIKQHIKGLPDTSHLSCLDTRTSDLPVKLKSDGFKRNKRIFVLSHEARQTVALAGEVFFEVRRSV